MVSICRPLLALSVHSWVISRSHRIFLRPSRFASSIDSDRTTRTTFWLRSVASSSLFAAASSASTSSLPNACTASDSSMSNDFSYFLNADNAAALDRDLMASLKDNEKENDDDTDSTPCAFTLEQLMELAGLSVSQVVYQILQERQSASSSSSQSAVIVCGPGNNGGDGLVVARHLKLFGVQNVVLVYPKPGKLPHYQALVQQARQAGAVVQSELPNNLSDYDVIVDAMFGFSFSGTPREPFGSIIQSIQNAQRDTGGNSSKTPSVIAVDVPSGWHVNDGDIHQSGFLPDVLVSLTAPKECVRQYYLQQHANQTKPGMRHFVGGRFVPPSILQKYKLALPDYPNTQQYVEITSLQQLGMKENEYVL